MFKPLFSFCIETAQFLTALVVFVAMCCMVFVAVLLKHLSELCYRMAKTMNRLIGKLLGQEGKETKETVMETTEN